MTTKTIEDFTPTMFKIYAYILKYNPDYVKLSQIAHDLHMSPQLTYYHAKKLVEMGYIQHEKQATDKRWEEYGFKILKLAPIEPLKPYIYLANRFLIPRQLIYITVFMALLTCSWLSPYPQLVQTLTLIPLIINLIDLYRQQRKLVATATSETKTP